MGPDQGNSERRITYFAATHTRGKREMFGIRAIDRGKHVYVIGKTGMGKSTMLENLAIQDIQNGEGIAFIDPHGSTAEKLLDFVPHDRIQDVIYFAPFDTDYPLGFNVMEDVGYDKRHLVVSGLMGALKRIWVDAWSARMEYILQNTLLALLEYPGSSLLDVNRMLTNKTFRTAVVEKITDPIVKAFWTEEFANFTDSYTREATPAIQNKIGQFTANPLIRNIVGQPKSSFDLRKAMDDKKIFIVNLSKGRMGETNASLLGSMLTVKIYLAAMSRADEPPARLVRLPRFYFFVDEFQSMMNEAFADILSESRKYKLALTLANQYIEQMEEKVREAVFGNIGTLITFRVGPFDAEVLKTVFEPTFMPEDLVGLGIGQIYLTLMIDGVGSAPFSAETIPPIEPPDISYRDDVIVQSREKYGRPRAEIEEMIKQKQAEFAPPPPRPKTARPNDSSRSGGNDRRERDGGMGPLRSGMMPVRPGANFDRGAPASSRYSEQTRDGSAISAASQNGPASPRDQGGTFDRRTGEFIRRDEPRPDDEHLRARERPEPRYSPQYAARSTPHTPSAHESSETAKRDALRAAILQASKPATPAAPAAAVATKEPAAPADKSPLDTMRERAQQKPQAPFTRPAPMQPQERPIPAPAHPAPQAQQPHSPAMRPHQPHAPARREPQPVRVEAPPPPVEHKPHPPRKPFTVPVQEVKSDPPLSLQDTRAGEVSAEILRQVINGDNQ